MVQQPNHAATLEILAAANRQCQLGYAGCTSEAVTTTLAGTWKAACKPCARQREQRRTQANMLATQRLHR